MAVPESAEVTGLLRAWGQGDESALEKLVPLVYDQLHLAARHYMAGERPGHTLQTTALMPEDWFTSEVAWKDAANRLSTVVRYDASESRTVVLAFAELKTRELHLRRCSRLGRLE